MHRILAFVLLLVATVTPAQTKPNFVVIFCDDLGYGDLGCYGHPTIQTPHLDRMAAEGQKWTSFYVAASVCTPSRAGLLTGRYPIRSGMASSKRRVLFPDSSSGLPASEITIPEALREQGYATAMVGKWHLGHLPAFLPTNHGFDSYMGIPFSNDMSKIDRKRNHFEIAENADYTAYDIPLIRGIEETERPVDQRTITRRYAEESVKFIESQAGKKPFFLYLAHSLPHIPLFRHEEFVGRSAAGIYGDVIEEIDWTVGEVRQALEDAGVADNTMVVFTSDNGPWLSFKTHGGSAGLLKEGKGMTYEGGMRVPGIFWWPGGIKPGVVSDMGSTLDLLPTLVSLAGGTPPDDRELDGYDLSAALQEGAASPREEVVFYRGTEIYAYRSGPWKAHFITQGSYTKESGPRIEHETPLLYHLDEDPREKFDLAAERPEVVAELRQKANDFREKLVPGEDQLVKRIAR